MRRDSSTSPLLRLLVCLGALMLFAGACGDDSDAATDLPGVDTDPTEDNSTNDDDLPEDRTDDLTGRWTITNYQMAGATGLADIVSGSDPWVEFDADGTVSFSTGCNTGGGEWETYGAYLDEDGVIGGQPLDIGPLESTEIGCEGDLGEQDLTIPGALRASRNFTIDDDGVLEIWNQNVMIAATR